MLLFLNCFKIHGMFYLLLPRSHSICRSVPPDCRPLPPVGMPALLSATGWQRCLRSATGLFAALSVVTTMADTVHVAVAANFSTPLKALAGTFEAETRHKVVMSSGATGKLFAQITSGAPFDVFLSADEATVTQLEQASHAVAGTRFTYATGRLALWSASASGVDRDGAVLKSGAFEKIALASPKTAPYGAAAIETLTRLGLLDLLAPKFVTGESIGQTYSFVATGNAPLGFVALSQVMENGKIKSGSAWVVPANLHRALRQDAVLLERGKSNAGAVAFLQYLKTDKAIATIRSFGYEQ